LLQTSRVPSRVPLLEMFSCLSTASSQSGHLAPVRSPDFAARGPFSCIGLFIAAPDLGGSLMLCTVVHLKRTIGQTVAGRRAVEDGTGAL
jgi:hypothetical protein